MANAWWVKRAAAQGFVSPLLVEVVAHQPVSMVRGYYATTVCGYFPTEP